MYCEKCGTEIPKGAKFCEKCGASVEPELQGHTEGVSHKKWIVGGIIGGTIFVVVLTGGILFATGILGGNKEVVQTNVDGKLNYASSHIVPEKDKKEYADGIYACQMHLGDIMLNMEIYIDKNCIKLIQFANLTTEVTKMYPLIEPSLEYISQRLYEGQSLESITFEEKSQFTQAMLIDGIKSVLAKAKGADQYNFKNSIDYSIVQIADVPKEFLKEIEEKRVNAFQMTYMDGEYLYIALGYGKMVTGGFSITVHGLYESGDKLCFETELMKPNKDEVVKEEPSYPFIIVKTEKTDRKVSFDY